MKNFEGPFPSVFHKGALECCSKCTKCCSVLNIALITKFIVVPDLSHLIFHLPFLLTE